jgi:predicted nucleotidyltransferase component of viral defense system
VSDSLPSLKDVLRARASDLRVPLEVIEKDYGLSYVLAAMFGNEELASSLVFKGGTALRKAYFPEYRFSLDLDFTANGGPRGENMEAAIAGVAREAERTLLERGPFRVVSSRRAERGPHPGAQEDFLLQIQYPWHSRPMCTVKVEISTDEPVLLPAACRPLLHAYEEPLEVGLVCYSVEEIVAEKLRTPIQALKRVNEGRWLRNCARDYYDLWYLTSMNTVGFNSGAVGGVLRQKCSARDVVFSGLEDFFPSLVVTEAERQWRSSLGDLVRFLPEFKTVITELRERIASILAELDGASDS